MAGIYKRKGSPFYQARVQRKGVEHRTSLETSDRRVAEKRCRQWLDNIEATAWGERPRIGYAQAMKQFVEQHCTTLKPASAERYVTSLKALTDIFGVKMLDEISKVTLSEFETERRTQGVSASTIRRDLSCLSSMLAFCEDRDWIEEGGNIVPAYLRRRAKRGLREGKARTRWLRQAEESALLAMATSRRFSKGALAGAIIVAIDTGLRAEEQFSLQWHQIDLLTNTIKTTTDTKNGRSREVPLQARSAQFLAHLKALNRARPVPSTYVFSKENGKRFNNLYRGFKTLAEAAGIGEICWHDLRRTAGCRWLQDHGKKMHEVSALLGHGSIMVTEKSYAFLDQSRVAQETAAQNPAHSLPRIEAKGQ
jgi:integrase